MKSLTIESYGLQSMTDLELIEIDGGTVDPDSFAYKAGYYTAQFVTELGACAAVVSIFLRGGNAS